jgi:hypothetical protein
MQRFTTALLTIAMLILLAVPAGSATEWTTRASTNTKGASASASTFPYTTVKTSSYLKMQVENPYSIRLSFRTTNNKANTVKYALLYDCSGMMIDGGLGPGDGPAFETIVTKADNSWVHTTLSEDLRGKLGRWCDVRVSSKLDTTARLHTRVQVKYP